MFIEEGEEEEEEDKDNLKEEGHVKGRKGERKTIQIPLILLWYAK